MNQQGHNSEEKEERGLGSTAREVVHFSRGNMYHLFSRFWVIYSLILAYWSFAILHQFGADFKHLRSVSVLSQLILLKKCCSSTFFLNTSRKESTNDSNSYAIPNIV